MSRASKNAISVYLILLDFHAVGTGLTILQSSILRKGRMRSDGKGRLHKIFTKYGEGRQSRQSTEGSRVVITVKSDPNLEATHLS